MTHQIMAVNEHYNFICSKNAMFSKTLSSKNDFHNAELKAVKQFLHYSRDFRAICKICFNHDKATFLEESNIVEAIQNATTFAEILTVLKYLDFYNTSFYKPFSKSVVNKILFFGGYISEELNVAYYMLHLRDHAERYMKNLGYAEQYYTSIEPGR